MTMSGLKEAIDELLKDGYNVEKAIGEGTFGVVVKATNKQNQPVAIKLLRKDKLNKGELTKVRLEIKAMQSLKHVNVIKLLESRETKHFLYMVIEFCSRGDLLSYVQAQDRLSEQEALTFFRQLLYGMDHAHKTGFLHRDIKLENLLITQDGTLKIGDWGFARQYDPDSLIRNEFPGSLHYASPEIVLAKPYTGPEVDVWSMGVTLYAMSSGCMPFFGNNDDIIVEKIRNSTFPMAPYFSRDLRDLLTNMLHENPTRRYTIEQIKQHPWISCKVQMNGITRVRSRSIAFINHVPQLDLNKLTPPTESVLTTARNIIVTPKGIITNRSYLDVSPPHSSDNSPNSSTSSVISSNEVETPTSSSSPFSSFSSSSPLSSPFSSGVLEQYAQNESLSPTGSPTQQKKKRGSRLSRVVTILAKTLKHHHAVQERTKKALKPNTMGYQSVYI